MKVAKVFGFESSFIPKKWRNFEKFYSNVVKQVEAKKLKNWHALFWKTSKKQDLKQFFPKEFVLNQGKKEIFLHAEFVLFCFQISTIREERSTIKQMLLKQKRNRSKIQSNVTKIEGKNVNLGFNPHVKSWVMINKRI